MNKPLTPAAPAPFPAHPHVPTAKDLEAQIHELTNVAVNAELSLMAYKHLHGELPPGLTQKVQARLGLLPPARRDLQTVREVALTAIQAWIQEQQLMTENPED